jgi:hypothetical protein
MAVDCWRDHAKTIHQAVKGSNPASTSNDHQNAEAQTSLLLL